MSITASNHSADAARYWGKSLAEMLGKNSLLTTMNTTMNDYEIRRLGYKDYGVFRSGVWSARVMAARYKCSYPEARRRWAMALVTKRLCA